MEYYILINNSKQGPFPKEELMKKGLCAHTLVWCAGMNDWQPASNVPDLADLLAQMPPEPPSSNPVMPKTWLVESILVTALCCIPFGIVGIVNASKVESHFIAGQYDLSQYYSDQARKWTLWGLASSLIIGLLYVFFVAAFTALPFLNE